jgi:preprotein translocase subunit YajC
MMALAEFSVLFAAAASPTAPNPSAQMAQTIGLMVFMGIMMYFLMFRPQQKKAREHAELLKTIKNGDKVVTSSGILGTIIGIKDKSVSLRSADTKLEVLKSSIADITERGSSEA